MTTLDSSNNLTILSEDESGNTTETIERMLSLGVSLAGFALPVCDLTDPDPTANDWADVETERVLARVIGTYRTGSDYPPARLRDSDFRDADFKAIRQDFWTVLSTAAEEVPAIRAALVEGRVDGGTYYGECVCLIGTIANARGCDIYSLDVSLRPAPDRPIERLFMQINRGDTPKTSAIAKLVVQWIDEWRVRAPA